MLSDEDRRKIFAMKGQMSARACAKLVGCNHKTVTALWGKEDGDVVFHTRARAKPKEDGGENGEIPKSPPTPESVALCDHYCQAEAIRAEMVANLIVSKDALKTALANLYADPGNNDNVRTVATISKTVQNAIEDLAKWIGLDKVKAEEKKTDEDDIEEVFSEYGASI